MTLIIDDRENEKVITKFLIALGDKEHDPNGKAEVRRLQSADYIIGDIGIEAKEINDLWRSILGIGRSRTINAQLADLVEAFERPMLVVYGSKIKVYNPSKYRNRRSRPQDDIARAHAVIKQFKQELYLRFPQIQFMQVDTMDHFVEWVCRTHKQQEISQRLTTARAVRKTPKASTNPQILALSGVPGVSERIAMDILVRLGSLKNVMKSSTTQKQLMETSGVSRTVARRILSLRDEFILD